ncbi:hypothetical protein Hrd1104_03610 [Halorhabdus sp. CBA1104]|uniref:hypothetical protein n=1 Tax=unclassified Halorhabdus TaxID=2621901 RepID=UPI0012B418E8|nr:MULTISPECIES: hypothetical protein [unclassified Halorhabdus]QGN06469.1 hypothetical protein Hrd1104_03610 [Halorhabdus sp. CBA1104]
MSQTVDDLRNEIRQSTGRFEREISTGFTKEDLAAISTAVGHDVGDGSLPGKATMRAAIAQRVEGLDDERDADGPFRKAELEAIAAAVADA